jgi:hypothetical protein
MATTSADAVIQADGTAILELGNPSIVHGLRIEQLAVLIAVETQETTAIVFNGLPAASTQLSASATGHDDVAIGPYYLPPGGTLTVVWNNATPGLIAQAWLTSSPIEVAPVNLGTLRFSNPLSGTGTRLVNQEISSSTTVNPGGSEVITFQPTPGRLWQLIGFSFSLNTSGGTGSQTLLLTQHIDGSSPQLALFIMQGVYASAANMLFRFSRFGNAPTNVDPNDPNVLHRALLAT